jgi:hypothetical protein
MCSSPSIALRLVGHINVLVHVGSATRWFRRLLSIPWCVAGCVAFGHCLEIGGIMRVIRGFFCSFRLNISFFVLFGCIRGTDRCGINTAIFFLYTTVSYVNSP